MKVPRGRAPWHASCRQSNRRRRAATGCGLERRTLAQDNAAPAWPSASSSAPPATPSSSPAPTANATSDNAISTGTAARADARKKNALPEVPPIPELPELPSTTVLTTPATQPATQPSQPAAQPSTSLPPELPINAPDARYGNGAGPNLGASTVPNAADAPNATPPALTLPTDSSVARRFKLANRHKYVATWIDRHRPRQSCNSIASAARNDACFARFAQPGANRSHQYAASRPLRSQ